MQQFYLLMHRDDIVCAMTIFENNILEMNVKEADLLPFLGKAGIKEMNHWIHNRCIPGTRENINEILHKAYCNTKEEFLFKNLALSIDDCYWLRPAGYDDLTWNDVNLFQNSTGILMPVKSRSAYSPDASLGGQMEKYIDMQVPSPVLVKKSRSNFGQQCINEALASYLHDVQGYRRYVHYDIYTDPEHNTVSARCGLFTDEYTEYIPAYEVVSAYKKENDLSYYDHYIKICEAYGIDNAREFMDYMTESDFVLTNIDRHTNNFGIVKRKC